jgi:hypothetical protein
MPSQIGCEVALVRASMACVIASNPVVAVSPLGRLRVKRGSRIATFGTTKGDMI